MNDEELLEWFEDNGERYYFKAKYYEGEYIIGINDLFRLFKILLKKDD